VDDRQIRKVFQHIVLNAREAMPGGGVIDVGAKNVTVKAGERGTLGAGNYVEVSFQDEGCGIAKENIAKIFDPYFTTKAAKGEKGIGLGLAVSYSIVKNHKGLITVESELNRGTTLHVFLPASLLTGALILSVSSVVSKTLIPGAIFPIGVVTSLIGVPFFISLILSGKKNSW